MKLEGALQQADERGWNVYVHFSGANDIMGSATRGDSNCPHQKPYSKSDGHGYEYIDETILTSMVALTEWVMDLPDYKR